MNYLLYTQLIINPNNQTEKEKKKDLEVCTVSLVIF